MEIKKEEIVEFEVLDKDYGRAWAVGPGYGEIDPNQYEAFLNSLKVTVEA